MSSRICVGAIGLLLILGLIAMGVFLPPDGQERGELAQFIGNFHPLAVHLPIALLLLVPLLEIAGRHPRRGQLRASAEFVLGLAVLSALAAPYLGWLLARSGGFEGGFVTQHMWGGISVAALALLCWVLRGSALKQPDAKLPATYVGMLGLVVLLVAFTGYRGGQLAHGENHLTEHLPPSLQARMGLSSDQKSTARTNTFFAARVAPILENNCLLCHSANKHKGGLRLDTYAGLLAGGKDGTVIKLGDSKGSDLIRRINLDPGHKDFMPAEGKPPLSDDERKVIALWIDAGASQAIGIEAIAGAPAIGKPVEALAPDYRADRELIAQLESSLRVRLVPRSQNPSDGLILRTASFPSGCDDTTLAKLAPLSRYIVDAELARTKVTNVGLEAIANFSNLRSLDLSHTAITSAGVRELAKLPKLQRLNLTDTAIDEAGLAPLRQRKTLQHLYIFETQVAS